MKASELVKEAIGLMSTSGEIRQGPKPAKITPDRFDKVPSWNMLDTEAGHYSPGGANRKHTFGVPQIASASRGAVGAGYGAAQLASGALAYPFAWGSDRLFGTEAAPEVQRQLLTTGANNFMRGSHQALHNAYSDAYDQYLNEGAKNSQGLKVIAEGIGAGSNLWPYLTAGRFWPALMGGDLGGQVMDNFGLGVKDQLEHVQENLTPAQRQAINARAQAETAKTHPEYPARSFPNDSVAEEYELGRRARELTERENLLQEIFYGAPPEEVVGAQQPQATPPPNVAAMMGASPGAGNQPEQPTTGGGAAAIDNIAQSHKADQARRAAGGKWVDSDDPKWGDRKGYWQYPGGEQLGASDPPPGQAAQPFDPQLVWEGRPAVEAQPQQKQRVQDVVGEPAAPTPPPEWLQPADDLYAHAIQNSHSVSPDTVRGWAQAVNSGQVPEQYVPQAVEQILAFDSVQQAGQEAEAKQIPLEEAHNEIMNRWRTGGFNEDDLAKAFPTLEQQLAEDVAAKQKGAPPTPAETEQTKQHMRKDPGWLSWIYDTWSNMDTNQKIGLVLGLSAGAISILNAMMGGDGLMTLLGAIGGITGLGYAFGDQVKNMFGFTPDEQTGSPEAGSTPMESEVTGDATAKFETPPTTTTNAEWVDRVAPSGSQPATPQPATPQPDAGQLMQDIREDPNFAWVNAYGGTGGEPGLLDSEEDVGALVTDWVRGNIPDEQVAPLLAQLPPDIKQEINDNVQGSLFVGSNRKNEVAQMLGM